MFIDLFSGQNALFSAALALTVALCVLEVILLMVGFSSVDADGMNALDSDGDATGSSGGIMGYLNVGCLGQLMPRTETTALSRHDLVGLTAVMALGTAKRGSQE